MKKYCYNITYWLLVSICLIINILIAYGNQYHSQDGGNFTRNNHLFIIIESNYLISVVRVTYMFVVYVCITYGGACQSMEAWHWCKRGRWRYEGQSPHVYCNVFNVGNHMSTDFYHTFTGVVLLEAHILTCDYENNVPSITLAFVWLLFSVCTILIAPIPNKRVN